MLFTKNPESNPIQQHLSSLFLLSKSSSSSSSFSYAYRTTHTTFTQSPTKKLLSNKKNNVGEGGANITERKGDMEGWGWGVNKKSWRGKGTTEENRKNSKFLDEKKKYYYADVICVTANHTRTVLSNEWWHLQENLIFCLFCNALYK